MVGILAILAGCSASADATGLRQTVRMQNASDAGPVAQDAGVLATETDVVRGVPDRSRDPSVVALAIEGEIACSGTLISPQIVLTSRRCLARTVSPVVCPADGVQVLADIAPASVAVLVGDDAASAHEVARGVEMVAPAGVTLCEADVGVLLVDPPIKIVKPAPVAAVSPARGDRIRTVGYGSLDDGGRVKLVREHVGVRAVSAAEFRVGESTCEGVPGGPALDEATGEVLGIVSREGAGCDAAEAHNIYTRIDTYRWLVDEAFARVAGLSREASDGGAPSATAPSKGTKSKPPTDVGGPCEAASDCAAGICLSDAEGNYCSRSCGPGDRCPNGFHCEKVGQTSSCVDARG